MKLDVEAYKILMTLVHEAENINKRNLPNIDQNNYQKTWIHVLKLILKQCTVLDCNNGQPSSTKLLNDNIIYLDERIK